MKTKLNIIDAESAKPSASTSHFRLDYSARSLGLEGMLFEKGTIDGINGVNVKSPDFLFAMDIENWQVDKGDAMTKADSQADVIWINPPNKPYRCHKNIHSGFLIMAMSPEILFSHFQGYLPKRGLSFINNYGIRDAYMSHMLQMFYLEFKHGGGHGKCFLKNLIGLFSNHFILNYSNIGEVRKKAGRHKTLSDKDMKIINSFVDRNLGLVINIDDLAELANMGKYKFSEEFKKLMGITPYRYIMNLKIDKAKDLLLNTDKQLLDISLDLGFSDSSHLGRTFKRFMNQTPSQFRQTNSRKLKV